MHWFWYFMIYSFLGCLLEMAFARIARKRPDRKRLLVLPLCPVYGLGACASLLLSPLAGGRIPLMFLLGAGVCTAAEYAMAVWYERGIGVSFWNYSGVAGNVRGRVCLPFSAAWGALIVVVVYWIHPAVVRLVSPIPAPVTAAALAAALTDAVASGVLLRRTGDRSCLRWYDTLLQKSEAPRSHRHFRKFPPA